MHSVILRRPIQSNLREAFNITNCVKKVNRLVRSVATCFDLTSCHLQATVTFIQTGNDAFKYKSNEFQELAKKTLFKKQEK